MELKRIKKHFSKQFIAKALSEVEAGYTRDEVCQKYGMSYNSLCRWLKTYASKEFLENGRVKITPHQKRLVMHEIQQGRMSLAEANLSYKIKVNTLQRWVRESKRESIADIDSNESMIPTLKSPIPDDLQRALHNANLKVLALETMIDVAEEQLKINIRKKPGAKQ
jgi:transposase-like protein